MVIDGIDYSAEMRDPLPPDMGEGNTFSIHKPKRGPSYIYWIRGPKLTKRQVKKARQRAAELAEWLCAPDTS